MRRFIVLALLVLGAQPALAQNFGPLDGTWEGDLTRLDADPEKRVAGWQRIVIQDYQAHVYYRDKEGKIVEVKPGKFQVQKLISNAIIAAIDTATDSDGRWVETWVFAATQKDAKTLIVNFTRQVNNVNLPLDKQYSKFAYFREGELTRK